MILILSFQLKKQNKNQKFSERIFLTVGTIGQSWLLAIRSKKIFRNRNVNGVVELFDSMIDSLLRPVMIFKFIEPNEH